MTTFFLQRQVTCKFSIGALLLDEPMLNALRREIRRVSSGVKVDIDELRGLLQSEVLKRDVFDGEEAKQAAEFLKKAARAAERKRAREAEEDEPPVPAAPATNPPVAAT